MIYSFIIPVLMPPPPPPLPKAAFLPSFLPSQYTRRFKVGDNDAITAITKVGRVELAHAGTGAKWPSKCVLAGLFSRFARNWDLVPERKTCICVNYVDI